MKLKKWMTAIGALTMSFVLFMTPVMAQENSKTETVYASLDHDGSVKNMYVVNHLRGSYIDYGTYTEIKNLSTLSEPSIEGDKITFPDEPTEDGLYYQGTTTGELPLRIGFRYYIDGNLVDAESLAGANGHLKILMDYTANESCNEAVREGLTTQLTAVFNTGTASNVSAEDASLVTVGNSVNASYIIMPGENGTLVMEADIKNFEMDPITITMLKGAFSISGVSDSISEFENGFDEMIDGADEMVDGTTELKDGMKTLAGKVGKLSDGLAQLGASGALIDDGMAQYEEALKTYISGVRGLKTASGDIRSGLEELAANGSAVSAGIADVSGNLSELAGNSAQLKALAESLAGSPDESVKALANGVLELLGGVRGLSDGLKTASGGLDSYVAGVNKMAKGYAAYDDGVAQLADGGAQIVSGFGDLHSGFTPYQQGVSQSADGTNKLYKALKGLPSNVQELIDGQIEFKDGIVSAKDDIKEKTDIFNGDSEPAVSFVSPDKNHPDSVQYILTTPGFKIKKAPKAEETKNEDDFMSRLADLFR